MNRNLISRFFEREPGAFVQQKAREKKTADMLTPREHEVLQQLTKGLTNKEIAQNLFISEKTVKTHLNNIFTKLHVSKRLEAILLAIKKGL